MFDDPNKLSNEKIREELTKASVSQELIDSIVEQFWFHDWGNSFISFPDHFQSLQDYLSETKPIEFSRSDFYSYFLRKLISTYEALRMPLQKIALVFELMQTDQLPISEFNELLKKVDAPDELSIDSLKKANLLSITDTDGKVIAKWIHHTLTEYLAASYILQEKELLNVSTKFMIFSQSGINSFIPSWTGALRFLLEQKPESFLDWIIGFFDKNPDSLDDSLSEALVFSIPSSISVDRKARLFNLIYGYYQNKKWWIPVWAYHHLYKFVDNKTYKSLKSQLDNNDFVHKGNIAATIDGMLIHKHSLLTKEERDFWKEKLIEYANDPNDNGVLQRHALAALENFKGETDIVQKVQSNADRKDSLVREAFINLCKEIDPNSPTSIEAFINAIEKDTVHIYARNALYFITSQKGIVTFLQGIANNQQFIHEFLEKESIFNNKEKQADKELIENIKKNLNTEVISLLKKIIILAFTGDRNYDAGKSYFLQRSVLIIQSKELGYLEELVETVKSLTKEEKNTLFINDIEGILSVLLKPDDLEKLRGVFTNELHHHAGYAFAEAIRLAPHTGNLNGDAVLKKGIELGITADPNTTKTYNDYQKQQEAKTYKQFQEFLSPPTEGKYFPQVFRYFVESQKVIEDNWRPEEKEMLLDLAINSNLKKIEPEKIKVRYKDQETKTGEYTISSIAGYFASVLQVIHILEPSVLKSTENRQKVINFIPFAYSNDLRIIEDILGEVTDEEIETLNKIMLDKGKDARYLVPQTYIYFSSKFQNLKSPKEVLISFATDPKITDSDRDFALKNLKKYLLTYDSDTETLLKSLWDKNARNSISDTANSLLISVFHDDEAINWRFNILKSEVKPHQTQEGGHWVGHFELELDSLSFAKPLIELGDEKYLDRFIELLDFSLTIIGKKEYWEYVNYLWRIAISFAIRDNFLLSESSINTLKLWAEENNKTSNINWFTKRLDASLEKATANLGRQNNISDALQIINE